MLSDFVRKWSEITILPIDVDEDVLPRVKEHAKIDGLFYFEDVDLDAGSLKGHHVSEMIPWGEREEKLHVTITYARLSEDLARLVVCKEMLHLLDPNKCLTQSTEDVETLIGKIVLPEDLVDPTDGMQVITDRMMVVLALAVLFPLGARKILLDVYKGGKLTIPKIAADAELPPSYVALVMHDKWPQILEAVIKSVETLEAIKS